MKKLFTLTLILFSFVTVNASSYIVDYRLPLGNNENNIYEKEGITIDSFIKDYKLNITYSSNNTEDNLYCLITIDGKDNRETLKNRKVISIKLDKKTTSYDILYNCTYNESLLDKKEENSSYKMPSFVYVSIFTVIIFSIFGLIIMIVLLRYLFKSVKQKMITISYDEIIRKAQLLGYRIVNVLNEYSGYDLVISANNIYFDDETFITCIKVDKDKEKDIVKFYNYICNKIDMEIWTKIAGIHSNPSAIIGDIYKGIVFKDDVLVFYDILNINKDRVIKFLKENYIRP